MLTESNACSLFINILSSVIMKQVRVIDTSKPTAKAIDTDTHRLQLINGLKTIKMSVHCRLFISLHSTDPFSPHRPSQNMEELRTSAIMNIEEGIVLKVLVHVA